MFYSTYMYDRLFLYKQYNYKQYNCIVCNFVFSKQKQATVSGYRNRVGPIMYIGMNLGKKAVFDFHMTRSRSHRDGSLLN